MAELTSATLTGHALDIRLPSGDITQPAARTRFFDLSVGLVENVCGAAARRQTSGELFSAEFQLALPHRGLFIWHVGGSDVVGESNQLLFVTGGEPYRMSQPVDGGYDELVITPRIEVLADIAGVDDSRLARHACFERRSRLAGPRLQSFRARFLHWARQASAADELAAEERVIALISLALETSSPPKASTGPRTTGLIRRAKEFLEAQMSSPIRLTDVGCAVGASPAYLTHVFRRVEGMSLHQYLTRLRLARALVELPHANDLTRLAFEVGFSSHSHFTAAFRRTYGQTPSEFRLTARSAQPPVL